MSVLRLGVVMMVVASASGFAARAHAETMEAEIVSNDYTARNEAVSLQLGTMYSTKFGLPIDLAARYAIGDRLYVDGRASYSPIGDIHALEVGGGATFCLLTPMTAARVTLAASPFSTKWTNVPDAARTCVGLGGGIDYQHYTVQATDPNPPAAGVPEVFAPANTVVFHGGLHVLRRQAITIRSGGETYTENAIRKVYLEAMMAPSVSADLPMGVPAPEYKKFGGRLGIENAYGSGTVGWAYRVEGGLFPGSGDSLRIFLLISFGVSFGL